MLRGTVQHEVLEGTDQIAAFQDGDSILLHIACKRDATARLDDAIPYGLAVTLEVAEGIQIPITNNCAPGSSLKSLSVQLGNTLNGHQKQLLQEAVAEAVGAGKAVALETVDFNDPNRPKTCLEVDFPILPVNQVAIIEGNAGKPIYQMSKWWARRRSSVFRSMLIAAATKAPEDTSHAAKLVWDNYYANHQKKGAFKHLKVADVFMGGGTTLVEGSRLGMQMVGNDLNPVAWFVVKQELANVDLEQVKKLLADIEAEVKPQIMPYYYCDGPQGEKGKWTHLPTGKAMPADFDPLAIPRGERKD